MCLKAAGKMRQQGWLERSCKEIVERGNHERQGVCSGGKETLMHYNKEVGDESYRGTEESFKERRVLSPVQEEALKVVELGSQEGWRFKGGNLEKKKTGA